MSVMAIWFKEIDLEILNQSSKYTLNEHLGIEFVEFGDDYLKAQMPVDFKTHQPTGILHGGASAALSETLGSVAANACVDEEKYYCKGMEINSNHLRSVKSGLVTGTAKPFHLGKSTQVWGVEIEDEAGNLVCVSRLTVAVREQPIYG